MEIDFEAVLKRTFTVWLRDTKTWKYIAGIYAAAIIFFALLLLAAFALFGPIAGEVLSNPSKLQDTAFVIGLIPTLITSLIAFVVIFIPLIIIYSIAAQYLVNLIEVRALQLNGLETDRFSIVKLFKLLGLQFALLPISLTRVFDAKVIILFYVMLLLYITGIILIYLSPMLGVGILLLAGLIGLAIFIFTAIELWKTNQRLFLGIIVLTPMLSVLSAIGFLVNAIIGIVFLLLALGAFLVYMGFVAFNGFRLSFSSMVFLHKKISIIESAKNSWEITKGNVLVIFALSLVVGIAVWVLQTIAATIGRLIGGVFDALLGTQFLAIVMDFVFLMIFGTIFGVFSLNLLPAIYAHLLSAVPAQSAAGRAQQAAQPQMSPPKEMPVQKTWPKKRQAV